MRLVCEDRRVLTTWGLHGTAIALSWAVPPLETKVASSKLMVPSALSVRALRNAALFRRPRRCVSAPSDWVSPPDVMRWLARDDVIPLYAKPPCALLQLEHVMHRYVC
jgi:hypothetical protein